VIPSFSWHPEHVLGMFRRFTGEDGSLARTIVCSPWQSVHTGESAIPPRIPFPWTLFSYCSRIPAWHFPHIVGMFCRWVADLGSSAGSMPWFPWQSEQTALPVSPAFFDASPWTLCSYAAMSFWSGRWW